MLTYVEWSLPGVDMPVSKGYPAFMDAKASLAGAVSACRRPKTRTAPVACAASTLSRAPFRASKCLEERTALRLSAGQQRRAREHPIIKKAPAACC